MYKTLRKALHPTSYFTHNLSVGRFLITWGAHVMGPGPRITFMLEGRGNNWLRELHQSEVATLRVRCCYTSPRLCESSLLPYRAIVCHNDGQRSGDSNPRGWPGKRPPNGSPLFDPNSGQCV